VVVVFDDLAGRHRHHVPAMRLPVSLDVLRDGHEDFRNRDVAGRDEVLDAGDQYTGRFLG
jgi:hypothetical protein